MDPNEVGDRLSIGITLLLTMTFFLGYINTNLPAVSYLKAIDLYLFVCLLLISFGVFESIIIYALIKLFNNEETKEYLKVNQLDIFLINLM